MSWTPILFTRQHQREAAGMVTKVQYNGPHGSAVAESSGGSYGLRKGRGVETGRTTVTGQHLPMVDIACASGPKDFTINRGIEGRVGAQALRISRPRFGLLPSGRVIHFDLEDGRRWVLISSGFAQCELRRGSSRGEAIFTGPRSYAAGPGIRPDEVALVVACETLHSLYGLVKILARLTEGI